MTVNLITQSYNPTLNANQKRVWQDYLSKYSPSDDGAIGNREVQDFITNEPTDGQTISAINKNKLNIVALRGNRSRYVFENMGNGKVKVTDLLDKKKVFYLQDIDVVRFAQNAQSVYGAANGLDDAQSYYLDTSNVKPPTGSGVIKTKQSSSLPSNKLKTNINGTEGDDTIQGTYLNDTIKAGDGDDVILSNIGNDTIDGGEGQDIAVFNLKMEEASVKYNTETKMFELTYNRNGKKYTAKMKDVEQLRFLDGTINLYEGTASNPTVAEAFKNGQAVSGKNLAKLKVTQNAGGTNFKPFG